MMSKIRLIVSDLDGTLLSGDHELTEKVKGAIQRFKDAGGMFTIATGRFGLTTQSIVDALDIDIPFILCNGGVIADKHKVWEASTLSLEELAPFLLEMNDHGITVMLFEEAGISIFQRTHKVDLFESKEGFKCSLIDQTTEAWRKRIVQKILIIGEMKQIESAWNNHRSNFQQSYTTMQSEDDYFEIIPPSQSKGAALKKLMDILQVKPSEVLSIGNQLNDMDMIENAGIGVAVANSHPALKERAFYVCSSSYGDGVVEAIETFCK